ncbi:chorismate mutase [Candidatus Phycosocius spiralis]|uniref:chorismate mutase n=1 Tax=Candidatus Phycosocius spiralis TaxID=2815099 RepID=A0ABQ4PUH4_9PROT|nr:chorismate mutase [Candidatus Phycosocius spiralis]GIU66671.1 hypothetical protein PsB1_0825 [Candidatus Phycosocius spiralis]
MNNPNADKSPASLITMSQHSVDSGADTVAALRGEIDAIDGELARLIAKRSSLAHTMSMAKHMAGDTGFGWHPAREVEILRSILAREPDLDPYLVTTIWRALIAANLAAQGGLEIITTLEAAPWARLAFSISDETHQLIKTDHALLEALTQGERRIGCLPWPDGAHNWWHDMMHAAFADLFVCAASPPVQKRGAPEALLVARHLPESSGDDFTLLAGSVHDLQAFDGQIVATMDGICLTQVPRFIGEEIVLPSGVRRIGCFALA